MCLFHNFETNKIKLNIYNQKIKKKSTTVSDILLDMQATI